MDQSHLLPSLAPRPPQLAERPDGALPPRRTNVSMACAACKSRKSKCDGGLPCRSCAKRRSECAYNEDTDQRRRLSVKRRIESLEGDRDLLLQLVQFLRDGEVSCVVDMVNLVRTDTPLSELRSYLDARPPEEKTPGPVGANSEGRAAMVRSESLECEATLPPTELVAPCEAVEGGCR